MKNFRKSFIKIFTVVTAALTMTAATAYANTNTGTGAVDNIKKISLLTTGTPVAVTINNEQSLIDELGKGLNSNYYNYINSGQVPSYTLGKDLDFSSRDDTFLPVGLFKGTFHGAGFSITGLYMDATNNLDPTTEKPYTRRTAAGGFVQVLANKANIENVKFIGCTVKAIDTAGTVAGASYGTISNVYIEGGKVQITGTPTAAGGLVGEYYQYSDKDTSSPGSVTVSSFKGTITDGNGNKLSRVTSVGGLIGSNKAGSSIEVTEINSLYWDMSTTNTAAMGTDYIKNPIGNVGNNFTGAIGFRVKEGYRESDVGGTVQKKLILPKDPSSTSVVNSVKYSELLDIVPSIVASRDSNWTLDTSGVVSKNTAGDGFVAAKVGTATATYKIQLDTASGGASAGYSISFVCKITVVAEKDELETLINTAKVEYPDGRAGDYSAIDAETSETYWKGFTDKLSAAETTLRNDADDQTQVDKAKGDLQAQINKLVEIDRSRLETRCKDEFAKYMDGIYSTYYESSSYETFKNAYNTAEKVYAKENNYKSSSIREAEANLSDTFNALKLKLKDVTIERDADNANVIINVGGYVKPDETLADGTDTTADISVSNKVVQGASISTADGKSTITIPKSILGNEFNLERDYKLTITSKGKPSEDVIVKLPKRPNFVTGDVEMGQLGTISLTETYTNTKITGVPLTYDPKTGEENVKVDGNVVNWAIDNDLYPDEAYGKGGTKHLKGIIAGTQDYSNPSDAPFYATGTVDVIDKTVLNKLLSDVSSFKQADYTIESWAPFNIAKEEANAVNKKNDATQTEIDNALKKLQDAVDGLKSQPRITFQRNPVSIGVGSVFEPKAYCKAADKADGDEVIYSHIVVTMGEGEDMVTIYANGAMETPLDTSKAATYVLKYSATNSQGITGSAELTVRVVDGMEPTIPDDTDNSNGTGSNGTGSGNNGGTSGGTVVDGSNSVSDGTIIIDFEGTDIFTKEEIEAGVKLIIESKKITDDTNIRAVLDKLASLLKGQVTIDGIYDITLYKEIDGQKTKISNSSIKNPITVYLPISQQAIDSKDYAVIHVLENGGYDLLKGNTSVKDGKNYIAVKSKSFSEYAVVYGGGISGIADTMDTSDNNGGNGNNSAGNNNANNNGNATNVNNNGNGTDAGGSTPTGQGGGDEADPTDTDAQGGADTDTALVETGDASIIIAVAVTAAISVIACIIIMIKKRKYSK